MRQARIRLAKGRSAALCGAPWRELLERTFKIALENCAKCGDPGESLTRDAPMALRATRFVTILGQ